MDTSSEYTFPIFISSTDYNLKDLRAELARFLSELGYKPILSSAEGFPDSSPKLEPWESCLPVLDKSFVVVLVIDGRYGSALNWQNYSELFSDKQLAPTHGEYLYAHKNKKRMLVFIRKEIMVHYQSYRTCLAKTKNNKTEAEKILTPTLPDYVDFRTLDFINEVKTTKPIPWIKEFEDITTVKKEIQKKMLNELAELFLIKNMHFETVIESFNKVMDTLNSEEQKKVLHKLNATKELTEAVDKLEIYKKDLEETKTALDNAQKINSKDKEKYEKKVKTLNEKITELEKETLESSSNQFYIKDGNVKFGNPNFEVANAFTFPTSGVFFGGTTIPLTTSPISNSVFVTGRTCDNCGKSENDPFRLNTISIYGNQFHTCPTCNRYLCEDCWPHNNLITTALTLGNNTKCPRCVKEGK